jgi:hypothetical protein
MMGSMTAAEQQLLAAVDLDGDEIVCDLTHLDSMIQRLGRLNRLGRTKSTTCGGVAFPWW